MSLVIPDRDIATVPSEQNKSVKCYTLCQSMKNEMMKLFWTGWKTKWCYCYYWNLGWNRFTWSEIWMFFANVTFFNVDPASSSLMLQTQQPLCATSSPPLTPPPPRVAARTFGQTPWCVRSSRRTAPVKSDSSSCPVHGQNSRDAASYVEQWKLGTALRLDATLQLKFSHCFLSASNSVIFNKFAWFVIYR